jgi:hypothetical protein
MLRLKSNLTVEQCIERLKNAIDPIPPEEERVQSATNTTWSPDPLPQAGRRTTGFGYTAGTRPVVGTITDSQFRLEKRIVNSAVGQRPVVDAYCTGHISPAAQGTLIDLDMERPSSSGAYLALLGLFAAIFAWVGINVLLVLFSSGSAVAPAASTDLGSKIGPCIVALLFAFPLILLLVNSQNSGRDREYLLRFVKLVCEARLVESPQPQGGTAYTGKTRPLRSADLPKLPPKE